MPQSVRNCQRCTAITKAGDRCRLRTCRGKKCWVHLKSQDNLRIRASTLPNAGLGLFAASKVIPRQQNIAPYSGERLTREQVNSKYGDERAEYVFCANSRHCIDGSKTNSSAARFANDNRGQRSNSKFVYDNRNQRVNLRSTRQIPPGDEIFVHYGADYWR